MLTTEVETGRTEPYQIIATEGGAQLRSFANPNKPHRPYVSAGEAAPTIAEVVAEKVELQRRKRRLKAANAVAQCHIKVSSPERASMQLGTPLISCMERAKARLHAASIDIAPVSHLRQVFPDLIPAKPYCCDDPRQGLEILSKPFALKKRHIQLDTPKLVRWLPFDIDRPDAYFAAEDANLPLPNYIAVNPENGHSLTAYVLAVPVRKFDGANQHPIEYLAAVQRGMRRRLEADPGYVGLIAKNPYHPHWRVDWQRPRPYELDELADALTKDDMRPEPRRLTFGLGRNCAIFSDTRQWAYQNVLACKRAGVSIERFAERLHQIAEGHNLTFNTPLPHSELRSIAKSIAKWTWGKFTEAELSRRQSFRAKRRWAGHVSAEETKPWEAEGVSRRTWYSRRGKARS